MNEDRLMRLHIPDNMLISFFTGRITLVGADLPSDAKVVQVHHDYSRRSLCLFIQSETFEPVEQGCEIPSLPPFRTEAHP
jgi:hypothetical protein